MKLSNRPKVLYMYDPDYGNIGYPYVFAGLPDTLRKMDIEVSFLDISEITFEDFRKAVETLKPELLLGFIQDRSQVIRIASFLKEYHPVCAVNWYHEEPNSVCGSGQGLIEYSAAFDAWFGIDNNMLPFWKTKAFFLPPGYDENIYQNQCIERIYDVSYVGQFGPPAVTRMYWPYMKELARYGKKALISAERPMGVPILPKPLERFLRSKKRRRFFQKFPFWRCAWINPKDEYEKASLLNQSKIHFGLNRVQGSWETELKKYVTSYPLDKSGLFYQLKSRPFQAVAAGALALNEYCPELESLFEIGKEIVTFEYGDVDGVRDKLAWYLSHDTEREKIARAGYERGQKCHTLACRIQQILDTVRKEL